MDANKSRTIAALVACAALSVSAETTITPGDGTLTYDVPAGETYQVNAAFSTSVTNVVKIGKGTMEVLASNASRTDLAIDVREGYVKSALTPDPFGAGSSVVRVAKGAALWYTGPNPGQVTRNFIKVEIAGDGPDGKGAFYRTGTTGGDLLITNLKLTDSATIGGDKRFGVRYTDLNYHTLTNKLTGGADHPFMYYTGLYGASVKNPGNIVQLSDKVTIQGLDSWGEVTDENLWTLGKQAILNMHQEKTPFPWQVSAMGNPYLLVHSSATMSRGIESAASGLTLNIYSDTSAPATLQVNGSVKTFVLSKTWENLSAVLTGPTNIFSRLDVQQGIVDLNGGITQQLANAWNTSYVKNGAKLRLIDAGDVNSHASYLTVCNPNFCSDRQIPMVEVSGNTKWSSPGKVDGYLYSTIFLGRQRDVYNTASVNAEGWGMAAIRDGAVVTNSFSIASKGAGALYLDSAELYQCNGAFSIANGGTYGYFGASNALFTSENTIQMAEGAGSQAHYVQLGGRARQQLARANIGGAGYANFYLGAGGSYDTATTFADTVGSSYFWLGYPNGVQTGGEAILTVDDNALFDAKRIHLLSRTNSLSLVNLNRGGCLSAAQMWYSMNHSRSETSRLLFSFNGGKLKYPSAWGSAEHFLGDSPDRIIIHELGGEIDIAANSSISCKVPLERPQGRSIKAISLPSDADFLAATNIGPAQIVVEGVGEGASAFASFDHGRGVLGNVVVTSYGTGYDDSTRAYVKIPMYPDRRFECGVELMDENGGCFLKSGSGTLGLNCTNTYAGATVVKGGILVANCDWAFPSNTVLRLEAGSVQCSQKKVFFECIEGTSGNVYGAADNVVNVQRLSLDAGENIKFASGVRLKVHGAWKLISADLAAAKQSGKTSCYSCPVEFADTATIEIEDVDSLDREQSPYVLASYASHVGAPQLVHAENLGGRWSLRVRNGQMLLGFVRGVAISFK